MTHKHPVQKRDIRLLQDQIDVIFAAIALLDRYALGIGRDDDGSLALTSGVDVVVPFTVAGAGFNSTVVLAAGTVSLDLTAFVNVEIELDVDGFPNNSTAEFAIQVLTDLDVFVAELRDDVFFQGNQSFATVAASFDVDDLPAGYKFRTVVKLTTAGTPTIDVVSYRMRVEWSSRPRGSAASEATMQIVKIGSPGPP